MKTTRWLLAMPLALAATIGSAQAASIRDSAGMFTPDAVKKAEAQLNRVQSESGINTTIETVESLNGGTIDEVSLERAKKSGTDGLFVLISKEPHKIFARATRHYARVLNASREKAIYQAFGSEFQKGNFDAGLMSGVQRIDDTVVSAVANGDLPQHAAGAAVPAGRNVPNRRGGGGFGLGSLLGLGLLVLAVLFILRLLGSLFGGGARGYGGPGMGRPGYGAPGYGGGGGGGFMSSIFGGLGGALAGNWIYDQMTGRHGGGYVDNSAYGGQTPTDTGAGDWDGGTGAGGDWGGGGGGGGGDWGGGGGGGGDWGGGGGGGDW